MARASRPSLCRATQMQTKNSTNHTKTLCYKTTHPYWISKVRIHISSLKANDALRAFLNRSRFWLKIPQLNLESFAGLHTFLAKVSAAANLLQFVDEWAWCCLR
jgi:hypothetical protein